VFAENVVAHIPFNQFNPEEFEHAMMHLNYSRGETDIDTALK
jgi:ubiquinone biosynthesis protein COQ9